ncbi:hypothetical protein [Corynebacterium sp. UBA2622]|uniref:hypothetical protein n=1 Tax=Corynebacterium sp. UBA2622 TaxID=1946393 RepID=UPI0025BC5B50|nr:hypothetical protein [Corynebacterium sp. UBA2622]
MRQFVHPRHRAPAAAGVLLAAALTTLGRLIPAGSATTWTFVAALVLAVLAGFLARFRPTGQHAYRRFLPGAFAFIALSSAAAALTGTMAAVARMTRDPMYSVLDDIFIAAHEAGFVMGDIGVPYVSEPPAATAGEILSIFILLLFALAVAGIFGAAVGVSRGSARPLGVLAGSAVAAVAAATATAVLLASWVPFVWLPIYALGAGSAIVLAGSAWVLARGPQ